MKLIPFLEDLLIYFNRRRVNQHGECFGC